MKKITKNINSQFNPTLFNYKYGGKIYYDIGGMMMPGGMLDMSQYQQQPTTQPTQGGPDVMGLGSAASQISSQVGGLVDQIDASKNNKPYANQNLGSAMLKKGMTGGIFGAATGMLSAKMNNDASKHAYQQQQEEALKQDLISNLPAQRGYVPTFANGGKVRDFLHKKVGVPLALNQFGYDLVGGNAPVTEKSLNSEELETLRQAVRTNLSKGKNYVGYGDYAKSFSNDEKLMYDAYEGGVKSNLKALSSPAHNLQKMLGRAAINVSGNDTTVVDNYDFNLRNTPKQFFTDLLKGNYSSPYQALENFGHTFGSKEGEGSPVKINISQKANGGEILDRVKSFDTGTLHKENGGIPIGQSAMVERDEYMFTTKQGQKYIFSNKF